jgi:hypothetical protein
VNQRAQRAQGQIQVGLVTKIQWKIEEKLWENSELTIIDPEKCEFCEILSQKNGSFVRFYQDFKGI